MTGSRYFLAAAALTFFALLLVLFGGVSVLFVDFAFFVEAFAVLAVIAGVAVLMVERLGSYTGSGRA